MKDRTQPQTPSYPVTPDGRYFVVRGRLWRCANPALDAETRKGLVQDLMRARRAVRTALRTRDRERLATARATVDAVKTALGERGSPWWSDGAADLNRRPVKSTPYAAWFAALDADRVAGLSGGHRPDENRRPAAARGFR